MISKITKTCLVIFICLINVHCYAQESFSNILYAKVIRVVDGDTITINNTKIRFSGIDAPESYYYGQTQYCKKPNGKIWACGKKATSKLKELINRQVVKCTDEGKDRYGRTLSICFVDDLDLQSEMVRSGMAIAYLKYSRRYEQEMIEAMTNKVGIWSGNFLDPEDWRRANSVRD